MQPLFFASWVHAFHRDLNSKKSLTLLLPQIINHFSRHFTTKLLKSPSLSHVSSSYGNLQLSFEVLSSNHFTAIALPSHNDFLIAKFSGVSSPQYSLFCFSCCPPYLCYYHHYPFNSKSLKFTMSGSFFPPPLNTP